MKRITVLFLSLAALCLCVRLPIFADEKTYSDTDEIKEFLPEDYLPDEINSLLKENGIGSPEEITVNGTWEYLLGVVVSAVPLYADELCVVAGLVIVYVIGKMIIDNDKGKVIISYVTELIMIYVFSSVFLCVTYSAQSVLTSLSDILKAVVPSFGAVLILGGGSFSAAVSSASFGTVLLMIDYVINDILFPLVNVMFLFIILERISPLFCGLDTVKSLKKNVLSVFSFTTTVFLTVLSYQGIISSAKDSLSYKTVRFAASSFIPVIGSALGESIRTVSAGIRLLKASVGGAAAASVFITVVPCIISVFLLKTEIGALSFLSGLSGGGELKPFFGALTSVLDILNAIIICVTILSLLLIIIFSLSAVTVIS